MSAVGGVIALVLITVEVKYTQIVMERRRRYNIFLVIASAITKLGIGKVGIKETEVEPQ